MSKAIDNEKLSGLRAAAIFVWRYQYLEERTIASTVEAIKERDEGRIERFREELQPIVKGAGEISYRINGGCVVADRRALLRHHFYDARRC